MGVSASGCLPRENLPKEGPYPCMQCIRQSPPREQNDRCKNITSPKIRLRAVISL